MQWNKMQAREGEQLKTMNGQEEAYVRATIN